MKALVRRHAIHRDPLERFVTGKENALFGDVATIRACGVNLTPSRYHVLDRYLNID